MMRAVFKLNVLNEKTLQKAKKLASRISGVQNVSIEGENLLAVIGYFDASDALNELRKIGNVAIQSVAPAGSGNKSDEEVTKKAGKQKEDLLDECKETEYDGLYYRKLMPSRYSYLKGLITKLKNDTSFVRRRKESKFELHDPESKFSGAGGSKPLQRKSEVVKRDTTVVHGGARSHKDVEIEYDSDVDRVDKDQGSVLSDTLSDLWDEIVMERTDSTSGISRSHSHSQPPLPVQGLIKKKRRDSLDMQLELENQSLQGIISEAGVSRTLEQQCQEVETIIKDIHVATINADSVSEIEAEEDSVSTMSMDIQSHMRMESSIVPHMQEITNFEEMNTQIACYLESIKIPSEMRRVVVTDQSPLLIKEDDISYLKSVYPRLSDRARDCLSHCALVYLNQEIEAKTLVYSCIRDGMVDTPQEVFRILQTLINFKLLHVREDRQFFILPETFRYILLDQVILSKSNQYFLMRSGKGLDRPPYVEEWEKSKEIHLMDNELSELPENVNCPELQALFLQRNYNLRVIPSTFFDNMPYLQVLNLSRTRIKTLPESLFRLTNLRRLFLNHCDLLMMLPSRVGELKSLEVLDLEGTDVINLPSEIQHLTNLTSLKVSFCEPINNGRSEVPDQWRNMFPWRSILTLPQVKELLIDVSPSDKRWNDDSEYFVGKLYGMKLWALKLYFPSAALLRHLKWHSTYKEFPPLKLFSITVGHHVERIIPRIPHDAELELEKYGKFLRCVNGTGFPVDVKRVLEHTTAFVLDRHTNARMLSEFGFENMINLVCCVVGECNELQTIHEATTGIAHDIGHFGGFPSLEYLCLYYMKNLKSIWKGHLNVGLSCLRHLTLRTCLQLETIFTVDLLANVFNLEELMVDDCPAMTSIATCYNHRRTTTAFLPNLKKISLHYLPKLFNLSGDLNILSRVEWISIYDCPALKSLPINKSVNANLKEIKGETSWWESLEWDGAEENSWDDIFVSID